MVSANSVAGSGLMEGSVMASAGSRRCVIEGILTYVKRDTGEHCHERSGREEIK